MYFGPPQAKNLIFRTFRRLTVPFRSVRWLVGEKKPDADSSSQCNRPYERSFKKISLRVVISKPVRITRIQSTLERNYCNLAPHFFCRHRRELWSAVLSLLRSLPRMCYPDLIKPKFIMAEHSRLQPALRWNRAK